MHKLVCINNIELTKDSYGKPRCKTIPLTKGKVYDVITSVKDKIVMVIDDNGESKYYHSNNFVTLDVWREMQLRKLDI